MRLHGVVKSTSMLSSRLGAGENTGGWMVEEFTAQMRAVSKIALHRRSNLALFLETNGILADIYFLQAPSPHIYVFAHLCTHANCISKLY